MASLKECDACGYVGTLSFFPDLSQEVKSHTSGKLVKLQDIEFEIRYQMFGTDLCLACTDLAFQELAKSFRERWDEEQAILMKRPKD